MDLSDKISDGKATLNDQKEALKDPGDAYLFAFEVPGADIEKCQDAACKDPQWAFFFALSFQEQADIKKCQEAACKDPIDAYYFAKDIEGADVFKSLEACIGTEFEDELNEILMNKVLV